MLALIGVLGIGLFIYLLARGRHSMIVAFIVPILLIPIASGLYTGTFSLKDMSARASPAAYRTPHRSASWRRSPCCISR